MRTSPTIKGFFFHSHLRALKAAKGEAGVQELVYRIGKLPEYHLLESYPVSEEVTVIQHVLDIVTDGRYKGTEREFEAGRFHFRNFRSTAFGILVLASAQKTAEGFKDLVARTEWIARRVFNGSNFSARTENGNIIITMKNSDYSIEHFRGFFHELMSEWGLPDIAVEAHESAPHTFEYTLVWERKPALTFLWR